MIWFYGTKALRSLSESVFLYFVYDLLQNVTIDPDWYMAGLFESMVFRYWLIGGTALCLMNGLLQMFLFFAQGEPPLHRMRSGV